MTATSMKIPSRTATPAALRLCRTAPPIRASPCVPARADPATGPALGSGPGWPAVVVTPDIGMDMALARRSRTRMQQCRGDVGEQDRHQHGDGEEQEQGL